MAEPLLQVNDLKVHFPVGKTLFKPGVTVKAVDGVSFSVARGEVLGLVGESGSGKTTLGRSVLRLIEPTDGSVRFNGEEVVGMPPAQLKALRGQMQIIFQDPYASLNPRMSVGQTIGEALLLHHIGTRKDRAERVGDILEKVGLPRAASARFPHEFSGGQRQRIGIARALAVNPQFIVADEPVSALDVSIQAQIINLLQDLRQELGLSILFIGHDLSVIEFLCDRVVVMYLGKIMETATAADLYANPRHPYTRALLDAAPVPDPRARRQRITLKGDLPSPINPPSGCVFRTRCPFAIEACAAVVPSLDPVGEQHAVACIRAGELNLTE
ncbi:ABC transporter ATP-binding protein [Devosia psychrophila]|uniref:Peptide ABC transporter ATP-binding protein n=1 Tax=Devosia psychrophila TaxID=728005 RepID=A0A0F5PZ36_9HYPH|nr:dipeptide ABC transporter ATP-binding protein [Devosia psychrophila]KKC33923.1 peptide ABC transporter ATP-binding protein [Devosia psychrophila]SFC84688.1 peptide/nickel transport system ATP-binding protein [Devosia psychrophila]